MTQQLGTRGGTPVSGHCLGTMRFASKAGAMATWAMDDALFARISAPTPAPATDRSEEA